MPPSPGILELTTHLAPAESAPATSTLTLTDDSNGNLTTDFYFTGTQDIEERQGGGGGNVTAQTIFSPVYTNAVVARNNYSGGTFSSRIYFTADANFNLTSVISTGGTVLQRQTYTSNGVVTFANASWTALGSDGYGLQHLYQGMQYDATIGWYFTPNRLYSPTMEVWNRPDPLGYIDTKDLYAFVADNPINRRDPMGLQFSGYFGPGYPSSPYLGTYPSAPKVCDKGGADITEQLKRVMQMAEQQWAKIGAGPDGDAEQWGIFTRASSIGGWDIRELLNNKSGFGGTGRGRNTVTVAGAVYPAEEVNYLLYGKLFRLAEDTWVNPAALGPLYGFGPWYGPQGASNIYNYRISIGLALSVLYSFTDHGDYRGIGPNADARVAWYWAGYSSDLTLPKAFAIKGVPPGPPYKGPITWHIGTESGTSMGGSF